MAVALSATPIGGRLCDGSTSGETVSFPFRGRFYMMLSMGGLMYAVVIAAFAVGVQAQTTTDTATQTQPQADTPKMTGAAGDKAKADADFKAAQEACNAKTGTEKDSCLKDAKAAHDRALGKKDSTMGAGQGSMGTSGQSSTGTGQSSTSGGYPSGGTGQK